MRRKITYGILLLLLPFTMLAGGGGTDAEIHRKAIIKMILGRLKSEHYSPREIDDAFSKSVWSKFLLLADPNRNIFMEEDLAMLRKYEHRIDDELRSLSLDFFNEARRIHAQRVREALLLSEDLLSAPFDFRRRETVLPDRRSAAHPATAAERYDLWRKRLKYYVLHKMSEAGPKARRPDSRREASARREVAAWVANSLQPRTDADVLFSLYVNSITGEMDPHTVYNPPARSRKMKEEMAGKYFGIGLELGVVNGKIVVKNLMPGGPAYRSGLVGIDDEIMRISDEEGNMRETAGIGPEQVAGWIRGEKGSAVKLVLKKRDGRELAATIMRDEVAPAGNGARSAVIHKDGKRTGYIKLPLFYVDLQNAGGRHCAADVEQELLRLKKENVQGVIIDLRDNPGGSLDEVLKMAGLFLPPGPVVQSKDREGIRVLQSPAWLNVVYDGPLTVMVNEGSASASEIFAAVIQDRARGLVLGTNSYGKGTVQKTQPMGKMGDEALGIPDTSYGTLSLTIQKFYRVNGRSTQLKGVMPDVLLPGLKRWGKIREKDHPSALPWDTVPAVVQPGETAPVVHETDRGREMMAAAEWLQAQEKEPVSLQFRKYRKQLAERERYAGKVTRGLQLPPGKQLQIEGTEDAAGWIKALATDPYLLQAADITNGMGGSK